MKNRKSLITTCLGLLITVLSLCAFGYGGNTGGGDVFDFNRLLGLITSNHVATLDQLIPLLPASYRQSFTLMLESGSLQSASPTHPRIIAYGSYRPDENIYPGQNPDRLYLGIQTDSSTNSKLPQSLEVIEWVAATKNYQFYQIDFPITPSSVKTNPETCTHCHGVPSRPNWTAYNRWDGAFGNKNSVNGKYEDDDLSTSQKEEAIASLKKNNTRLQGFDFSNFLSKDFEYPNAYLGEKIASQLMLRDTDLIRNLPEYAQLKYAFAGAFLGCVNYSDFFEPATSSALGKGVFNHLPETFQLPGVSAKTPEELTFEKLWQMTAPLVNRTDIVLEESSREVTIATWLRFIFEGSGEPEVLKNILGTPPTAKESETWSYDFAAFMDRLASLGNYFLENAQTDFPDVKDLSISASQETGWMEKSFGTSSKTFHSANGPANAVCQQLAGKSRTASAGYLPSGKLYSLTAGKSDDAPILSKFNEYCAACHTGGARPLPLDSIEGLKKYRTASDRSISQRLFAKEMPPAYAPQPESDPEKDLRKVMQEAVQ